MTAPKSNRKFHAQDATEFMTNMILILIFYICTSVQKIVNDSLIIIKSKR